jgi:hypothetical protein
MKVQVSLCLKILLEGKTPCDDEYRVFPILCREFQFIEVEIPDNIIELLKYIDFEYLTVEIEGGRMISKKEIEKW